MPVNKNTRAMHMRSFIVWSSYSENSASTKTEMPELFKISSYTEGVLARGPHAFMSCGSITVCNCYWIQRKKHKNKGDITQNIVKMYNMLKCPSILMDFPQPKMLFKSMITTRIHCDPSAALLYIPLYIIS